MKVYVKYEERCTRDYWDGEQYGRWERDYDSRITGVCLEKPEGFTDYEEFELGDVEVNVGDEIFVLYMRYGTGDSFGRADGKMEVIWAFTGYSEALAAERAVRDNMSEFSVKFKVGDRTVQLSNPAAGYFESCEDLDVESFILKTI